VATAPAAARYDSEERLERGAGGKTLQGEGGGSGCWPCGGTRQLSYGSSGPTTSALTAAGCRWLRDGKGGAEEATRSGEVEGEAE
jgi:hypothetical protein